MKSFGIYTLANDVVFDQLVALLNSIEANVSPDISVCVIPFDDRLDQVRAEIDARHNVTLFDNWATIEKWESFVRDVWAVHPTAKKNPLKRPHWGLGHHRKYVAFDGLFDSFLFYDADSLAMMPVTKVLARLEDYDFVFDDWEHTKPRGSAALDIDLIEKTGTYSEAEIRPKLHCSSFFASKRGIFDTEELAWLKKLLIEDEEVSWISRWWDDAFWFTYMTLRSERPLFNFTLSPDGRDRTGNCANADAFVNQNQVLYNQHGLKPIHRIHYMSYSSKDFAQLAQGTDVDIPHKDVFLHYRYLKQPDQKPHLVAPSNAIALKGLFQKVAKKTKQFLPS
jgi:hypothetical protein